MRKRILTTALTATLTLAPAAAASGYDRAPAPSRSAPSAAVSFLRCVIAHESGGNPRAQNPTSTASGLFQFLDSTWRGNARWVDGARKYDRASHAPAWVQWRVALHSVSRGGHSNWAGTSCGYGT